MPDENLPLKELEKQLCDPSSDCYLENILDLVTSLVFDCDFPSASKSSTVQVFLNRFKKAAELIAAQRTKYADFELIKVIGRGAFGRVELARHKRTRRVYAIKTMSKQHLLDRSQFGFWAERDIMVKASSEWLVACHHAFLDKENVYLCMEFMPGGDVLHLLEKYDVLNETTARFYLAEAVLALETLHNMHFIHRDIKPENMLLDSRGHLKLADFGTCVQVGPDGYHRCEFSVGTPDYVSPEMLSCNSKSSSIGPECDWWALGVVAYEMIFGDTPFYGESLVQTYSHIFNHEKHLSFPTDTDPISAPFEDLIRCLLKPASTRLGSLASVRSQNPKLTELDEVLASAAQQVKSHPFFESVSWQKIRSQDPPYQPVVNSEIDTSNIDFDPSSSEHGSTDPFKVPHGSSLSRPPAYFTGNHLSFAGFTFNRDHTYLKGGLRFGESVGEMLNSPTEQQSNALELKQKYESTMAEVSKLRQEVEILEKQSATSQVALNDAQRRLKESLAELEKSQLDQSQQEKILADLRSQFSTAQNERDHLNSELSNVRAQLKNLTQSLEAERVRVAELDEQKLVMDNELDQLRINLRETESRLQERLQIKDELQDSTSPSAEHIASLEDSVKRLQAENKEARQKAAQLISEASALSRNHTRQVNELNNQLEEAHRVCLVYQTKCESLTRDLSTSTSQESALRAELDKVRTELQQVNASRRSVEDRLLSAETELASTRVELRNLRDTSQSTLQEALSQVAAATELADQRLVERNHLSSQLDEMRARCADAEKDCDRLTKQVASLQKERDDQQCKLNETVNKLYQTMTQNPTPAARNIRKKMAKEHDPFACQQLQKNYKNLQSEKEKMRAEMQQTIDQFIRDLAESKNTVAQLAEDCRLKDQELTELRVSYHTLCTRLDQLSHGPLLSIPSRSVSPGGDTSNHRGSLLGSPASEILLMRRSSFGTKVLEQIVDLNGQGKGRKKLIWIPNFAVLKGFSLAIYTSKADRDQGSPPVEEIQICRLIHVRQATAADLIHAKKDELQRIIQLFYTPEDVTSTGGSGETSEVDLTTTSTTMHTGVRAGSTVSINSSHPLPIRWLNHKFQSMQFRRPGIICDVCNRPLHSLTRPPPALECTKCHIHIHLEHVEQHEKFIACNSAAQMRYLRLPTNSELKSWLEYFNQLMLYVRQMKQNPNGPGNRLHPGLRHSLSGGGADSRRSSLARSDSRVSEPTDQ